MERNACGTVAMIHAVANSLEVVKLGPGALKEFIEETKSMNPEERSKKLEKQQVGYKT
jgi:ubiquitin carboxyl-terminal hydrolase L3